MYFDRLHSYDIVGLLFRWLAEALFRVLVSVVLAFLVPFGKGSLTLKYILVLSPLCEQNDDDNLLMAENNYNKHLFC